MGLKTKLRLLIRGLRYRHMLGYDRVDGWLHCNEAAKLFDLARGVTDDSPVVVEIGSFLGKSTIVLGKGLMGKNSPKLYCIDPFDFRMEESWMPNYSRMGGKSTTDPSEIFLHNLEINGVRGLVDFKQAFSHDVAKGFEQAIDLLFIDGDHSYDAVKRDIEDWAPMLKPDGFIAFHDVDRSAFPGTRRAIDEFLTGNPNWVPCGKYRSLLVVRKSAGLQWMGRSRPVSGEHSAAG